MADKAFVALRRIVTVGADLVDAMNVYAWGLDREFAGLRAACATVVRRMTGNEGSAQDAGVRSKIIAEIGAAVRWASLLDSLADRLGMEARDDR